MGPMMWSMLAAQALASPPPMPPAPSRSGTVVVETLLEDFTDSPPPPPAVWQVPEPKVPVRVTNMEAVFNEGNYPFWAMKSVLEGDVRFRVAVDASGRALGCEVVEHSNVADLDRGTCSLLMEQARFAPALDRRGRPIPGIYSQRVRWRLENREPYAVADESVRAIITVDAAGHRQCRIEASPGADVDPRTCQAFLTDPALIATVAKVLMERSGQRDRWELVYHQGSLVPGGPAGDGEKIGLEPGEQLISRGGVRLTIDAAGKVTECATLKMSSHPDPDGAETCAAHRLIPYAPGAAGRSLIRMGVTYVRGR